MKIVQLTVRIKLQTDNVEYTKEKIENDLMCGLRNSVGDERINDGTTEKLLSVVHSVEVIE